MKKTLTILLFLLTIFFFGSQQMLAQDFTVNGINYSGSATTLTATLVAPANRENCSGDIIIPSTVIYGGNTYTVTKIGRGAFEYTQVTSVSLPNTITEIGDLAFECRTLKSVDLGEGVTHIGAGAFGATAITSIRIPQSVRYIGQGAFASQTLESVTMEEGVMYIGEQAFSTSNITSVQIPQSVTHIGQGAFEDCKSLSHIDVVQGNKNYCSEDGILYSINKDTLFCYPPTKQGAYRSPLLLKAIAGYAFYGSNASSVVLSDSLKYIGRQAFFSSKVVSVIAPNSTTLFADRSAFSSCNELDTIILPKKAIVTDAFSDDGDFSLPHIIYFYDKEKNDIDVGCSVSYNTAIRYGNGTVSMNTCTIPDSLKISGKNIPVTNILEGAFDNCAINDLTIPKTIKKIESKYKICRNVYIEDLANWIQLNFRSEQNNPLFHNSIFYPEESNLYLNGNLVTGKLEIPQTVDSIGDYAFYNYRKISSLIIPNSVKSIGKYAFSNTSIDSITLGNSVVSIGEYALNTYSKYIYLPASVQKVAGSAFKGVRAFKVAEENPNFCAIDGILYSHSKDTLVIFPFKSGTFTVPEGVTTIGEHAFYETALDTVITSNSVSNIEEGAFSNCPYLKMLVLSAVNHIAKDAISENYQLRTIYCKEATPPVCEDDPFVNTNASVLWVPNGCVNTYKNTTFWNHFEIYSIGDILNSIKEVKTNASDSKSGICYDLQGRLIDTPTTKGIYIRNGKKFMIK